MEKVFGIGFHKTGTTSLALALQMLGYRVTGPNGVKDPFIADNALAMAMALVEQYDAFQDNPWPMLYREVDERCPGAKFILTYRNEESWINSLVNHFDKNDTPMRKWIYGPGSPVGNENVYLERYKRHNQEVREYFKGRASDFIEVDIMSGDGWPELCGFLGCSVPDENFPHANKSSDRNPPKSSFSRVNNFLKNFF
ncbi:sulfotransferase family protein [Alcanivorax sp. DP30]|uniref:sulfotransferase family protein n=1 Tax=Alcanivorax sp. DP30 TaxID=2606217 RepID=UPI0013C8DBE4|nr:sulfotransferase family protein [Alcanivorax sp. DP30]MZR64160.1 hypothetical protein [Alcanivorax sp. DP30]